MKTYLIIVWMVAGLVAVGPVALAGWEGRQGAAGWQMDDGVAGGLALGGVAALTGFMLARDVVRVRRLGLGGRCKRLVVRVPAGPVGARPRAVGRRSREVRIVRGF